MNENKIQCMECYGYFNFINPTHLKKCCGLTGHYDSDGNLKEKDKIRQNEIEEHLGCKFIRINENKCDYVELK